MGFCLPNFCAELDFMGGARSEQNTLNAAFARATQPILNVVNLHKEGSLGFVFYLESCLVRVTMHALMSPASKFSHRFIHLASIFLPTK